MEVESTRGRRRKDSSACLAWLSRGSTQNCIVGLVAFCCPGMFNAMQGLGGAGGSDPRISSAMNVALYATFTVFGCFGGLLFNLLGNRALLCFGGLTYVGYAAGVYAWGQNPSYGPLAVMAAALLGIGAGCLWTAQGAMTMSYATEAQKGTFTAVFWVIFNLGGVIGGLITFLMQFLGGEAAGVSPATYFAFCAIMLAGSVLPLALLVHPSRVRRDNGEPVIFEEAESPLGEARKVMAVFCDTKMLWLTPLFLQSNWFYTYEFNAVNSALFNPRTRGLNSSIFWGMQMASALVTGSVFLDSSSMRRKQRAQIGLLAISSFNVLQWVYAACVQYSWTEFFDHQAQEWVFRWDKGSAPKLLTGPALANQPTAVPCTAQSACYNGTFYAPVGSQLIDFTEFSRWVVPGLLFACMGWADASVQTYAYWMMGSIANGPSQLARYAGYYKGIQSLGAALAWGCDLLLSNITQMWICCFWAVLFPLTTFVVARLVTEHTEEVKSSSESDDETDTGSG